MPFNPLKVFNPASPEFKLDRLVLTGFARFEKHGRSREQTMAACDTWLEAWELFKEMLTPDIHSVLAFQETHPKVRIDLENWLMHLEMELHNAGLDNPRYTEERLRFSREYQSLFPEMDANTRVSISRAEGEALWALGRQPEAEAAYQKLVETLPDQAWGYIGWADQYFMRRDRPRDYERAESLLRQALARPNLDDRAGVLDRLIDLYDYWDRPDQIPPLEQELEALLDAENERLREENQVPRQFAPSRTDPKPGRNDPCWCGSGKKYKKCHEKSDKSS